MYRDNEIHVIVRLAVFDEIREAFFCRSVTLYDNLRTFCILCGHADYPSENSLIVYDPSGGQAYDLLRTCDAQHMYDGAVLIVI